LIQSNVKSDSQSPILFEYEKRIKLLFVPNEQQPFGPESKGCKSNELCRVFEKPSKRAVKSPNKIMQIGLGAVLGSRLSLKDVKMA